MTAFTFTPSVPSATTIRPTLPSSTASTSMVALSVSISQTTWPDLTVSPSLTCHLASLPSVMVGDSAGIRMLIDMVLVPRQRLQTSRAASTMFSGCGSASFSRLAA